MHDLLYSKQDSLGLKPFEEFARDAGVTEARGFQVCLRGAGEMAVISDDARTAVQEGFPGTPTVIVNGMRLPGVPDADELVRHIQAILGREGSHILQGAVRE